MFMVDTLTVDSRVASIFRPQDESSSGGGAYARDKNTSARLCARNGGGEGAYVRGEGGCICGTLR